MVQEMSGGFRRLRPLVATRRGWAYLAVMIFASVLAQRFLSAPWSTLVPMAIVFIGAAWSPILLDAGMADGDVEMKIQTRKGGMKPIGELRLRRAWWSPFLGLVLTVGCGHSMVLMMNWLWGAPPPQEFRLGDFVLVWLVAAGGWSLVEGWSQRTRWRRQGVLTLIPSVIWFATFLSAYLAAANGELRLIWADVLTALAFALSAVVRTLIARGRGRTGAWKRSASG